MARSPRTAWAIIIAHAVLIQVFTYAARPGLSYAVIEAGGSAAILGLIGTAFALPALLLALPAGRYTDRIGERAVALCGGLLVLASGIVALCFLGNVIGLIAAAFLLGVGHLLSIVSEQTAVAHLSREGGREGAFGLYTLAASLGQAVGPLLLSLPDESGSGPDLWLLFLCSLVIAGLLTGSSAFLGSVRRREEAALSGTLSATGALLRSPGVLRALIASSLALGSIDVTLAFWPALGSEFGVPAVVVSAMLTARAITTMASRAALPMLSRWMSRRVLLASALFLSALGLVATGIPLHPTLLVGGSVIFGFAIGVCQPITMAWLTDVAPSQQRGVALSLRLAGNRLGQSALPALTGTLAPSAGVIGILIAAAGTLVVAAAVSFRARSR